MIKRGPGTIMAEIAALLAADPDIQAWVPAKFPGKALRFYIGSDDHELPKEATLPHVAMKPGSYTLSDDRSHRLVTIAFSACILKSGETADSTTTSLDGLVLLEELYYLIEAVLERYSEDNYNLQVSHGEAITEIVVPLFRIAWSLSFQESAN